MGDGRVAVGGEPGGAKGIVEGLGVTFVLSVSTVVVVVVVVAAGLSAGGPPPESRFPSLQTESRNLASASSASITGEKLSDRLSNVLQ